MKKRYLLFFILWLSALTVFPQMYILNEDFNGANGTTPPTGWSNIVVAGDASDSWHFDNPGDRIFFYPITAPFAIFDSDSTSANGEPEEIILETPLFDASISNYILLHFVHVFNPGNSGTGSIQAYDGNTWHTVITYTVATTNPSMEMADLSAFAGGITNARLRFTWSGNGSGYWAIDNIRIYASLPLDGGVVSIDDPSSPVVPGLQNVVITLGNFGYNNITSTKIDWTANGIAQAPYTWNGSVGFGQTLGNIVIGTYNFQDPVMLKVWQSNPNGQSDLNPYNDTISKYIVAALCGTYTVGGSNADFESLSQAADVLNIAGVTCPVTFLVRDGLYYDQFELREIPGASEENTITFRSESGDSTQAVIKIIPGALKFEPMIFLNGSKHVHFENLGLATGSAVSFANNAILINSGNDINITGCYFEIRNQFDFGIEIRGLSHEIEIDHNRFESISARAGAINITGGQSHEITIRGNNILGASDWGYPSIRIGSLARKINVSGNSLERCYRAIYLQRADSVIIHGNLINNSNDGVYVDELCTNTKISGNRLTNIKSHQNIPDGTSGVLVKNSSNTDIFNNFIHTTGDGPVMGISLENATSCRTCFNSINVTNKDTQGKSKGILLLKTNQVYARNNIFRVRYAGTPVYINEPSLLLDFDKNDYYSADNTIGYYNGILYDDLATWAIASGMDANSMSVIPFYTSDTDLSINQVLLNNTGQPVPGISDDIDGTLRDPVSPDIGAKEYDPCENDAGINAVVSPSNPLSGGTEQVIVLIQNQGTTFLTSVLIHWSVNEEIQATYPWTGNMPPGGNSNVAIGDYYFQPGILYTIKAWSSQPNNTADCNNNNDTNASPPLATPLCGNYTIGGISPDFATVKEAVNLINLAGITCPVTFYIRDGIYYEQSVIKEIAGTSEVNTVTFRSQSGDSSLAIIQLPSNASKFETVITLDKSRHIIFRDLGLFTGATVNFANNAIVMKGTRDIRFENCYFRLKKDSDLGIGIQEACQSILIKNCRIISLDPKALAINAKGGMTRDINIIGNNISGATEWGYATIRIGNDVSALNVTENVIENCNRAIWLVSSDSAVIKGNIIKNVHDGIYIDNWCTHIEISANRLIDIKSHENAPEGTSGILINNVEHSAIFNNFVHTSGNGPVIGISLQNATSCKVSFNSLNITNNDVQGKSKGFNIKNCSGLVARNNIINILNSGTPVYFTGTTLQLDFDYNDYYSLNKRIGSYSGIIYYDLVSWRAATNMDLNSLSVTPFYTTSTDLSINQALLNNSGSPVEGISHDIDGMERDPVNPDIGAKEYDPCATDAGINAVVNPQTPLTGGIETVVVILQNQGTNPLSSVRVNWSVNDGLQSPYVWSGNLAAKANTEISAGEYNFQAGQSYVIKAWTSEPNGAVDCNHKNDTVSSGELAGPLCGTYTIGGVDPDFATLSQAAEVLNSAGITCPVIFLVRDGIYREKFIIREIAGASAENTITFRSESGDSTLAVIKIDPEAVNYEPMILLDKSQYIYFQGLGLFTGSSQGIANVALQLNGAKNIELERCYFEIRNDSDFGILIQGGSQNVKVGQNRIECVNSKAGAINIAGPNTREIDVLKNYIFGAGAWGNTLVKIGNNTKIIKLNGNYIERSFRSVYIIGTDSIEVRNNTVKNSNSGIYFDNLCSHVVISGNRLINIRSHENSPDGTSGIFVQNSTEIDVVNNFVQTAGAGPILGINLQNTSSCRAYYNSVNITNTDAQGKSKGIYLRTSSGIMARNNIFNIKATGLPIHIDVNVTNFNLDYNNYFSPSGVIGKVNEVVYSNLFSWGETVNGDANSKVVNPYFKADTIPLPYQRILNGAGITIAGISYDIDGKLRHFQAPDIGCFEFFVDYGILELLSPTLNCFQPEVDSVRVYLRQFGDVPFENLKVAYQLDNGVIHIDTIPGPLIYDIIHTFGTTETISAPGEYLFKVWLINTLDDNIKNDTLKAKRYSKPAPLISMGYENLCTGWEVHFNGSATVAEPYYIDQYEWFFGDGDTSYLQNPVHIYEEAGTYEAVLRAYSDAGCYSEAILQVIIDPNFQGLQLGYMLVNETCLGDGSGSLEIIASGGNPPYNYYLNDQLLTGNTISGFSPGKYKISIVDVQNCSASDSVESISSLLMNPQIQATPLSGYTPLTVNFDFTADSADTWIWHFPGSITDTGHQPTFTFTEYGTHVVNLAVNSGPPHFCTETTSINIFVDIIITIDINSVFTPNEDGFNDYFEVKSVGLAEMNVKIYNQWGNKVYEITEVDGRWDGTTSGGAKAPDGTYFYSLRAKGVNDQLYDRKGSVLLLRHGAAAYPNPVNSQLKVETYESLQSPVSISVYSVYGQLSHSEVINDPANLVVDLSHLKNGIYILKASDGKRDCFVRIIKN
jgi:gliding motility-associated-like protein